MIENKINNISNKINGGLNPNSHYEEINKTYQFSDPKNDSNTVNAKLNLKVSESNENNSQVYTLNENTNSNISF